MEEEEEGKRREEERREEEERDEEADGNAALAMLHVAPSMAGDCTIVCV